MLKKTEVRMAGRNGLRTVAWAGILLLWSWRPAELHALDGFQIGQEAYAAAEADRQAAVQRQVQLNDALRWRAGVPPANGVFYYPFLPSLDPFFAPGPFFPGEMWGYRYIPPSRQPIGRVEIQTGPNRWESRPLYATPAPVVSPPLPGPPPVDAGIGPEETPRPIPGPREF
jgi:hypothetical protein